MHNGTNLHRAHTGGPRIQALALVIQNEIKKLPQLRRNFSGYNQRLFSVDLALVAHHIRTGYLLDLAAPENAVHKFSSLVDALRANHHTKDLFAHVLHIFEPSSEQSFFVNVRLLAGRIQANITPPESTCANSPPPVFLDLVSPIRILDNAPTDLLRLLDTLLSLTSRPDPLPLSFSLPTDVSTEVAVPLAAVLLDYPIAYVPSMSDPHALSGSVLDFYEGILISGADDQSSNGYTDDTEGDSHTIMKFSCPAQLTESDRCRPATIISQLKEMFAERLRLTEDPSLGCNVVHTKQTVDRVAF